MTDTNHRHAIFLLLFSIVIVAVFAPALFNGFIMNLDDHAYVTGNPSVTAGLTWKGVAWAFTAVHSYNWHPLTWLSHMLDVQIFGLNPIGHHLVNILFHVANSLLLFGIFRKLTGAFWRSLLVAALFAFHPLHVESVVWIAERKDVLSTFFGFLAILAYFDFARTSKASRYFLLLLFFVLSLMSKQMFVTLPFLLLLLDYWPLQRFRFISSYSEIPTGKPEPKPFTSLVIEKLPLFFLAIGSSIITYFVQKKSGALNVDTPLALNIGNAVISYVRYIAKMFWPHPLAAIYPFDPDQINYLNVTAAGIFVLAVSYVAFRQIKKRPYFLLGWLWYLGTLVPVIGLVRIGDHALADRYTYLPIIGLFVAIVWGANELIETLHSHRKAVAVALSITVLSIFSLMTIQQTKYWKNDFVLFQHTIESTGDNAPAHRRLGQAYGSIMNVERSMSEYKIARLLHYQYLEKIKPNDFEVHYLLGTSYLELQRYDDAIREYLFSLKLNDKSAKLYNNLGIAYYHTGNIREAKRAFVQASLINPGNKEALHNLDAIEKKP